MRRYATDAAAAEALARAAGATLVVAPGTSRWMRVLPGVAHRLGGRVDTHLTALDVTGGTVAATRWYYRQRIEAVQGRTERPWILVVDPGCHAPWSGATGGRHRGAIAVDVPADRVRTRVTGVEAPSADAETIRPDADLLFVAGAGWTKKQADGQAHPAEAESLILGFLARSKASLGSSKSLVDLSGEGQAVLRFMTHMNQVGQTGSTPRHPKGLSTCCHGEEPHVVGWRFVNERRAINLDPNCGWARGKADVLYVADAFAGHEEGERPARRAVALKTTSTRTTMSRPRKNGRGSFGSESLWFPSFESRVRAGSGLITRDSELQSLPDPQLWAGCER